MSNNLKNKKEFEIKESTLTAQRDNNIQDNSDNSIKDSYNKTITVQEYVYKELTKEELKELRKKEKSARFGLATLCQKPVRCIGLLIDNVICDNKGIERSTVINLVDLNTNKYLSDHINIARGCVEDIFSKVNNRIIFVEIYGRVYKYDDGDDRFAIDPKQLKNGYVETISETIINPLTPIDYTKTCNLDFYDLQDIEEWLQLELNTNELKLLVDYLRRYINIITKTDLQEDFVYNYIINNYLLNSSQFELFYKELPTDKLNKNHYIELVFMLTNIIIKISRHEQINIIMLFEEITNILLSFMGVKQQLDYKKCVSYEKFRNSLVVNEQTMNYVVNNMMRNFKIHPFDVQDKNKLIKESCHFLKIQKQNLKEKITKMKYDKI